MTRMRVLLLVTAARVLAGASVAVAQASTHGRVDSNLSDEASFLNFIEYTWHLPRIPGSADQVPSKLDRLQGLTFDLAGMLDFRHPEADRLVLSPVTGQLAPGRSHHGSY